MTLKFNDTLVQAGIADSYLQFTGNILNIKLYPASVPMPTTVNALNSFNASTTPGFLFSSSSALNFSRNGGKVYMSSFANTGLAAATGTIAWAAFFYSTGTPGFVKIITDAVSATDPNSVVQVNTLSAVSGQQIIISAVGFNISGV